MVDLCNIHVYFDVCSIFCWIKMGRGGTMSWFAFVLLKIPFLMYYYIFGINVFVIHPFPESSCVHK